MMAKQATILLPQCVPLNPPLSPYQPSGTFYMGEKEQRVSDEFQVESLCLLCFLEEVENSAN